MAIKKEENMVTISFEVETDLYFQILQYCLDNRETIDQFVTRACQEMIKRSKTKKGRQEIVETVKRYSTKGV